MSDAISCSRGNGEAVDGPIRHKVTCRCFMAAAGLMAMTTSICVARPRRSTTRRNAPFIARVGVAGSPIPRSPISGAKVTVVVTAVGSVTAVGGLGRDRAAITAAGGNGGLQEVKRLQTSEAEMAGRRGAASGVVRDEETASVTATNPIGASCSGLL